MSERTGSGYHAARWDEPLIDEIGDDGRGLLPPKVDEAIADAVGDVAAALPEGSGVPLRRRCPRCRSTACSGTSSGSRRCPWAST